jgi:hypothetical protein
LHPLLKRRRDICCITCPFNKSLGERLVGCELDAGRLYLNMIFMYVIGENGVKAVFIKANITGDCNYDGAWMYMSQPCWLGGNPIKNPGVQLWIVVFLVTLPYLWVMVYLLTTTGQPKIQYDPR